MQLTQNKRSDSFLIAEIFAFSKREAHFRTLGKWGAPSMEGPRAQANSEWSQEHFPDSRCLAPARPGGREAFGLSTDHSPVRRSLGKGGPLSTAFNLIEFLWEIRN